MKYKSLEQIAREADIHAGPALSRRQRLERWAKLLEQQPERRLSTIEGTEFGTRRERAAKRADNSPLTVAFEDPVLRAEGLQGDRVGDAIEFFNLSEGELHRLVCYCHYGLMIAPGTVASRLRIMARRAEASTLPPRRMIVGGLSAAAALGLVFLAPLTRAWGCRRLRCATAPSSCPPDSRSLLEGPRRDMTRLRHPLLGSNLGTLVPALVANGGVMPSRLPHAAMALGAALARWPFDWLEAILVRRLRRRRPPCRRP